MLKHQPLPQQARKTYALANQYDKPWQHEDITINAPSVSSQECRHIIRQFANYAVHLPGDYAEFGIFRGGSAFLICKAIYRSAHKLHLFDTFCGIPSAKQEIYWQRGDFENTSLDLVKAYLKGFEDHLVYYPGRYADILSGVPVFSLCFAHIDCDTYEATHEAGVFVKERLIKGGVVIFDDYGDWVSRGAQKAVDEIFQPIIYLTTKQALYIAN